MFKYEVPLGDWLEFLRLQGHDYVIPTPPECAELWARARSAGTFRLGSLFVLKAPLLAFTGGVFNPRSGDIWVWDDEQEPRRTIHRLLHELAHAGQSNHGPPRSIEEDWARESDTWRQAHQLAVAWGCEERFSAEELEEELATIEMFRERHAEAAVLAGSQNPLLARAAYTALALVGWEQKWDKDTFDAALWGYSDDSRVTIAAVTLDRQGLRHAWSLIGDEERSAPEGLDLPLDDAGASLLRSVLSTLSREQPGLPDKFVRHRWGSDEQRDLGFIHFTSQYDLRDVVRHAMKVLLAYPETSAFARWTVYKPSTARGPARIYRLTVDYRVDGQRPPSAELWVLVTPSRERDLVAEAAWQWFIRSWLKVTGVRQESLLEGFQELWGVLGYAGVKSGEN